MAKGISKTSFSNSSSYRVPFYEKPVYHYALIIFIVIALIASIIAMVNTSILKKSLIPKTVSINEFLKKLTAHQEIKSYIGIAPLNIVQINNNNFANLQAQISGMDISYLGNYIVQYSDRVIVYDFENDKLRGNVALQQSQQEQLPADFFEKLNKHSELQGLQQEKPVGGQLDSASLETLKKQFPDIYSNAKAGDFLLRYKTRLIIYDYANDKIVNAVNLG